MSSEFKPILSLCIPTNGIVEWVIPAVESIYNQHCDESLFEVIITDNGNTLDLKYAISEYKDKHFNLIYKKTNSILFQNQIDCFKLASGELIKFINHRSLLIDNTINILIELAKKYKESKPIVYFSNNYLKNVDHNRTLDFDAFMNNLSYYSSWSGGISCWKSDLEEIFNKDKYDNYFPHLDLLFAYKNNKKYIINNDKLIIEQKYDVSKKGKYDLFYAFATHYIDIIYKIYNDKCISKKTLIRIKNDSLLFIIGLHFEYVLRKKDCSYIIDNFWNSYNKHYTLFDFFRGYFIYFLRNIYFKIIKIIKLFSKFFNITTFI